MRMSVPLAGPEPSGSQISAAGQHAQQLLPELQQQLPWPWQPPADAAAAGQFLRVP